MNRKQERGRKGWLSYLEIIARVSPEEGAGGSDEGEASGAGKARNEFDSVICGGGVLALI